MRKNKNSKVVLVYDESGNFIGKWPNITECAKANGTTTTTVSSGIYSNHHFFAKRFWLKETDNIKEAMCNRIAMLKSKKTKKQYIKKERKKKKTVNLFEEPERVGPYIFIPTNLDSTQCCIRCALANSDKECLPCRKNENHDNGYWRYCEKMDI